GTELARLLAGGAIADSGSSVLDGHAIALRSPGGALRHHIAMASEDRLGEGVITGLSIRDNIVLALQSRRGWARPISRAESDELVAGFIDELGITPARSEEHTSELQSRFDLVCRLPLE